MLILFKDEEVRSLALSFEHLVRKYGERKARQMRRRLDELDAAGNLGDVKTIPAMRCRQLKNQPDLVAICTLPPSKLLLQVDKACLDRNLLNWQMVTTVKVITLDDITYE